MSEHKFRLVVDGEEMDGVVSVHDILQYIWETGERHTGPTARMISTMLSDIFEAEAVIQARGTHARPGMRIYTTAWPLSTIGGERVEATVTRVDGKVVWYIVTSPNEKRGIEMNHIPGEGKVVWYEIGTDKRITL